MSAHISTRSAASDRQETTALQQRIGAAAALVLALTTSACFQAPPSPVAGPDPSNPRARVPPVAYRSTIGGYISQRPVEPRPWVDQNQRVAPTPHLDH